MPLDSMLSIDKGAFRVAVHPEFGKNCSTYLVEVFVEDDEHYYSKMTFDAFWLKDLIGALQIAHAAVSKEAEEFVLNALKEAKGEH